MPPGGPEVAGRDAIRAWFQGAVDRFRFEEYRVTSSELVTHGDWALRRGEMFWRPAPKSGDDPMILEYKVPTGVAAPVGRLVEDLARDLERDAPPG